VVSLSLFESLIAFLALTFWQNATFSTPVTGLGTADVPVLRLRQAFWLADAYGYAFSPYLFF
jgi:hypothetical protein